MIVLKKIRSIKILIFPIVFIFITGCGQKTDLSYNLENPVDDAPLEISSPEETLELFIESFEKNNPNLTLNYLSITIRKDFENILPRLDLKEQGRNYRDYPPRRLDDSQLLDGRADFVSKQVNNGELTDVPLTLQLEGNTWKITQF